MLRDHAVRKPLFAGVAAATLVLASAGTALAVSGGGYDFTKQHCTAHADTSHDPQHTEDGCHSSTAVLYDGNGHEYANVGTQQQPDGSQLPTDGGDWSIDPGSGSPQAGTFGNGRQSTTFVNPAADPSSGLNFYFGADDNLDNGEHDNSPQGSGGPSDGGAINLQTDPGALNAWMAALLAGDVGYLSHHPFPMATFTTGAGADGHDFTATTDQRTVYAGGQADKSHRDASDYDGANWDPSTCAGPSDTPQDCGGRALGSWNAQNGTVYAEPGVQVYEDPDPQGSPEPAQTWPNPAVAATTCGVYVGGGAAALPAGTPGTNSAGQIAATNPSC